MLTSTEALRGLLAGRLARYPALEVSDTGLRRAAVALTVVPGHRSWSADILLTRRNHRLRAHAGQWALPGGQCEPGESAEDAARRELHEELGLSASAASVIGRLDDYVSRSGYLIAPIVLWVEHAAELEPNPAEVASVHRLPLNELASVEGPRYVAFAGVAASVFQLPVMDARIHAPTGAIVYQFRERALKDRDFDCTRVQEPPFAWA